MIFKNKKVFINTSIILLLMIAIFSGSNLIRRKTSETEVSQLIINRSTNLLVETQPKELPIELIDSKYDYKPNDNSKYLSINPDFTGWIEIAGTALDYPVLRSIDNVFYLTRDIYKNNSDAGAIFMDYRNLGQFNDQHTIIYGHYMKNGTMFGGLHDYKEENHFNTHDKIKVSGLYGDKIYTIFSVYIVSADDYKLEIDFEDGDYANYLQALMSSSMYKKDFILSEDKALLTLATCSYETKNGRMIIHAIED